MNIFLVGVSCVGKTAIGARLAQRLGCPFFDLDVEIEKHFGRPIEQLWHQYLTPNSFRKERASVVLQKLIQAAPPSGFVMALMPSGLMDSTWSVLKKVDRVVVALRDSPDNILARITFYDAESRPITKVLTDKERLLHRSEIKKDITYFGRSFHRADLNVDIDGLDVEASAIKIEELLPRAPKQFDLPCVEPNRLFTIAGRSGAKEIIMKNIAVAICLVLLAQCLARADAPTTQPVTGTFSHPDDGKIAAALGHTGILFIRSEARWKEFRERLGAVAPVNAEMPKVDFAKQAVVMIYADDRRRKDAFSLIKSDLAVEPPRLDFLLDWDPSPEKELKARSTKFIFAIIPACPAAKVTLLSNPDGYADEPAAEEFRPILGGTNGCDIVDGLQVSIAAKAATIKPGEDIVIDISLHLADPQDYKPWKFAKAPKSLFVWDDGAPAGYRNHAFFVTTPDGKAALLRPAEHFFKRNGSFPVEITADKPYHLPNWATGTGDGNVKSLKSFGLDTSTPGVYTISGLYEETGSTVKFTSAKEEKPTWIWAGVDHIQHHHR